MVSFSTMLPLAAVLLLSALVSVSAHGWLSSPSSRQDQCHKGLVKNCGQVQYEPQSVEAVKGKLTCNGDVPLWAQLADNSMPWVVQNVAQGVNKFTWTQTAPHLAASWIYYIQDPTSLVMTKIGEFLGTANTEHCLDLSAYSGVRKILAVWNVADTVNAFYSCVDVNIAGTASGTCVGGGADVYTPVSTTGCTTTTQLQSYVVAAGDTLSAIAAAKGVTLASVVAANTLKDINVLEVGQSIIIPAQSTITCTGAPTPAVVVTSSTAGIVQALRSSSASKAAGCSSGTKSYTVKTGDTFNSIAEQQGTTVAAIVTSNPTIAVTGTTINLPRGSKYACAAGCVTKATTRTYTVLSGDNMDKIAFNQGVTLTSLITANPTVVNPALINVGQVLNIPVYTTTC